MSDRRTVRPLGDAALVADTADTGDAQALARALARWSETGERAGAGGAGIEEIVTGFRSVTVIADPDVLDMGELAEAMAGIALEPVDRPASRRVEIPVAFDGPDLGDVAGLSGLGRDDVVGLLVAAELEVAFVGFAPGFAYLIGLPRPLADLPRRNRPRESVPAGSVALGGGFAGIYPSATPGGWHLVGSTAAVLFQPETPPYALLAPGDRVRLVPGPAPKTRGRVGPRPVLVPDSGRSPARGALIEEPGLFSVVQDGGRIGVAAIGVPRAGAADLDELELANRLVGNDATTAAALECSARGPSLRLRAHAHMAVVGDVEVRLDGHAIPSDLVFPVAPDQLLEVGEVRGSLRAYVAIAGGFRTPLVLGSRSSDVLCRLGPGRLVPGDELGFGTPGRPHGRLRRPRRRSDLPRVLRVVVGPDAFPDGGLDRLCAATWTVDDASNRVGVRLVGPRLAIPPAAPSSRGVVTGTIQVPPDGAPIVLSCDHATVGGYAVPAVVVRADLGQLGRCRPGDPVRFEVVDLVEAARLRAERARHLDALVTGWFPTRSD